MRNRPSGLAAGGGLGAAGAGLAAAGGGPLLCTSVLRVHALMRGRDAGGVDDGSDASIEAVVGGAGCGAGGLAAGADEPPNQPAKGFQPLDCFGAAGAGLASGPQVCSAEAVRVGARETLGMAAGASGSPVSASPASW